jgi:hypothetical protein
MWVFIKCFFSTSLNWIIHVGPTICKAV